MRPADIEELEAGEPREVAAFNARAKAQTVQRAGGERVLGADTLVALDGEIFGKPSDEAEARATLRRLAGRTHDVVGAIALVDDDGIREAVEVTRVTFRALDDAAIDWYLAAREWDGRAGAYAIQERGGALVRSIAGDYLNVVGLPVGALLELVPDLLRAS